MMTESERRAFLNRARSMLGVRWRHQGRGVRGVDCAGLVIYALDRPVIDCKAYGRVPYQSRLESLLRENLGSPLSVAEMQVGDVVLMEFKGAPSHVGILGDYPYGGFSLIHAHATSKKVVEGRLDAEWGGSIVEVYRP